MNTNGGDCYYFWQGDNQFIQGKVSVHSSRISWADLKDALSSASDTPKSLRDTLRLPHSPCQLWRLKETIPIDPEIYKRDISQVLELETRIKAKQYSKERTSSLLNLILNTPGLYLIVKTPGLLGVETAPLPAVHQLTGADIHNMSRVDVTRLNGPSRDSEQTVKNIAIMFKGQDADRPWIPKLAMFQEMTSRKRWIPPDLRDKPVYQQARRCFTRYEWETLYDESPHHDEVLQVCTAEELVAVDNLGKNRRRIVRLHTRSLQKSSSVRVTHFCSLFTLYPLALDPADDGQIPADYEYREDHEISGDEESTPAYGNPEDGENAMAYEDPEDDEDEQSTMDNPAYDGLNRWRWQYTQDVRNGIKIVYRDQTQRLRSHSPKNDFALTDTEYLFSPLFGEIDSNEELRDKWRMLIQSVVGSRIAIVAGADCEVISSVFVHKSFKVNLFLTFTYHQLSVSVESLFFRVNCEQHFPVSPRRLFSRMISTLNMHLMR
ncbi:hypothetical protein K435DRAFT_121165 [Dendrothele bispora CBS 962.96]|uniref:Uncharacterized protein n=1 Tax=Dendrothele bispora (strain CBS 962.96) TaxID=1314807 RepID=A0A4S8MQY9_DENBC|nr:hypothetical protein K435DRAFT_121165 [Dendrothele bispora CBS 962.96]